MPWPSFCSGARDINVRWAPVGLRVHDDLRKPDGSQSRNIKMKLMMVLHMLKIETFNEREHDDNNINLENADTL